MFLLRAAFWLSLVVLMLPADKQDDTNGSTGNVSAYQAITAAHDAFSDLSQFCARNPDTCVTGNAALHVFGDKLRTGVKMLSGAFGSHGSAAAAESSGTLTPADLKPAWHDPAKRNAAT